MPLHLITSLLKWGHWNVASMCLMVIGGSVGYVINRYSRELLCSYNRNIYNNIIKHLFWNYHVDIAMVIEIYYKRDFM